MVQCCAFYCGVADDLGLGWNERRSELSVICGLNQIILAVDPKGPGSIQLACTTVINGDQSSNGALVP
jgi:hypothetical protein